MILWVGSVAVAATPCAERPSPGELEAVLEAAERALGDLDSDGFLEKTTDLATRVACLEGVLDPRQVARIHRAFGLRAWLARQEPDARAAFSSSRNADPDYVFPFWMVPESHALRELYSEADPAPGAVPVIPAREGMLWFDGAEGDVRPLLRPVVVQLVEPDGSVERSAWLRPTDPLPPYESTHPVLPPLVGAPRTLRTGLLVSSAAFALTAVAAYGGAALANTDFQKASDRDALFGSQRRANNLVVTSGITGGVAVASFTGALLVGRF
ncbi:MAG: hypothetical protein R3F61_20290 [Myxococcota bacterium]